MTNVKIIKTELIQQKNNRIKGNLYYFTQINFAYNSNHIEGSRLTEEQTEAIFDTMTLTVNEEEVIMLDDVIESRNHFKLFNYILDNVDSELSIEMILKMHKILKTNTSDEDNPLYSVGEFKKRPNIIGIVNLVETTNPKLVEKEISNLLNEYKKIKKKTLEDIIDFHVKFDLIHPFSDGNGRVGRIIMFKECLKNNILPFIILDENKAFYMRGLKNYKNDKKYLIDTCKNAQDTYENVCKLLIDEI